MPLIQSLDGQDLTRVIRQGPEEPGRVGVFLMLKPARNGNSGGAADMSITRPFVNTSCGPIGTFCCLPEEAS
jgi:hypothetical protein